ncbi:EGF-like domain [Trinorchestia longiramus]|nr:EGF-like domain [Trinorchestia longiramus]
MSTAHDLHFTLTSGSCKEGSVIKLYFGSTDASLNGNNPGNYPPNSDTPDTQHSGGQRLDNQLLDSQLPHNLEQSSDVELLNAETGSGHFSGHDVLHDPQNQMVEDDPRPDRPRCTDWVFEDEFRVTGDAIKHVVLTPLKHRRPNACIKFEVQPDIGGAADKTKAFEQCLVLDNLALASTTSTTATVLVEDFDSFEPSNWLAFPNGIIEPLTHHPKASRSDVRRSHRPVEARRTDRGGPWWHCGVAAAVDAAAVALPFQRPPPESGGRWTVLGGGIGSCGSASARSRPLLVMGGSTVRRMCTPPIDAREVGALHLSAFSGCPDEPQTGSEIITLSVFAERASVRNVLHTALLGSAGTAGEEEIIAMPIPASVQKNSTRFCVEQQALAQTDVAVWAVESIILLPHMPSVPSKYFQARLNLGCSSLPRHLYGRRPYEAPVLAVLESSTDYGRTWTAVHEPCLPGACEGSLQSLSAVIGLAHEQGWEVVTVPLPYHSLTPHTRLRLSLHPDASGRLSTAAWAVDDVFVGACEEGCSGRGLCLEGGACRCEFGYRGKRCELTTQERPPFLAEPFSLPVQASANLAEVWGGDSGYQCDVVGGEGAAGVFRGWGERSLYTVDINTTESSVLQFHYFGGTVSQVGKCPGADQPSESVYVHVSCNAGLTWTLLHTLHVGLYHEPRCVPLVPTVPQVKVLTSCTTNQGTHQLYNESRYVPVVPRVKVGKCPGADQPSESVYVHVSCNAGLTWTLLHTLHVGLYHEPSHVSLPLPSSARGNSCRFRLSQPQHSGPDHDMWAVDDLTVTAQALDYIQLYFQDLESANSSLRFHLGSLGSSCGRDEVLVFPAESSTAESSFAGQSRPSNKKRLMETKSLSVGPSFMMQFQLMIGCGKTDANHPLDDPEAEAENVVMLEYSLNHGLSWHLVQRPCSPSTPGCRSHFTRGTVYHSTEFHQWKRVTLRLPRHTWSPVTRLRLREGTVDADGNPSPDDGAGRRTIEWAVDDLYIGHRCSGHCSGHGQCTSNGCICDENFHGQACMPVHKLHRSVEADFDDAGANFLVGPRKDDGQTYYPSDQGALMNDLLRYGMSVVGGHLVDGNSGCGSVVSGQNLYFGAPGVRQLEVDDMAAGSLQSIQFHLTVGGAASSSVFQTRGTPSRQTPSCFKSERPGSDMSEGSVVVQYSTDGGLEWTLLQELVPDLYRTPKLFRHTLPLELVNAPSGVVRFRIWQPKHGLGDQWALDHLLILPAWHRGSLIADAASNAQTESPWLTITGHQMLPYCPEMETPDQDTDKSLSKLTTSTDFNETRDLEADAQLIPDSHQVHTTDHRLSFVLNGPELIREAATKPLNLSEGDVLYFMIHLGCATFSADAAARDAPPAQPVYFEYTADGGQTWDLVVPPCPPSALHCTPPTAPSVYKPEFVKGWAQVMVDVLTTDSAWGQYQSFTCQNSPTLDE